MAIGFASDTKFVRESTDGGKLTAPIRLIEREYTNRDGEKKSYFTGMLKLSNGQCVWVSVGGTLDDHTTKNGKPYVPCKVTLTGGRDVGRRASGSRFKGNWH